MEGTVNTFFGGAMRRTEITLVRRRVRWLMLVVSAVLALWVMPAAASSSPSAGAASSGQAAYATTTRYVIRFFPRLQTWWYQQLALTNRMIAPIGPDNGLLTSRARLVNAFNVDTVYASSARVDVSKQPVVFTIPKPNGTFSLATVDVWGEVFSSGIPTDRGGTYALALASWHGTLPRGVTRVTVPYPVTTWTIRADRYSRAANGVDYVNSVKAGQAFVRGTSMAPLSQYKADPSSGRTVPIPQLALSGSTTQLSDQVQTEPESYLDLLQRSVHSPDTVPFSASDRALSASFDAVFARAKAGVDAGNYQEMGQIVQGAQNAYETIQSHFYSHTVPGTFWINFNDIADWGTRYLDRAATSAHIFLGNSSATARYWDAYSDANGQQLDTDTAAFYTMTFDKGHFPDSKRFWSVTAYVGTDIHLTPGPSNNGQRNVAEYTPGLFHNPNGSVTILMGPNPPANRRLRPNWLFVPPNNPFSVVVRVYGPTGDTSCCVVYKPPPIKRFGVFGPTLPGLMG